MLQPFELDSITQRTRIGPLLIKKRQAATNLARAVVIDNKYYLRVRLAGVAKGRCEQTVRKYSKVKRNWNYFDKLTENKKKTNSKLRENHSTGK